MPSRRPLPGAAANLLQRASEARGVAAILLVYAVLWAGGADNLFQSLTFGALAAGVLVWVACSPDMTLRLRQVRGLPLAAVLFATTVVVALASLVPWSPGGEHPVWTYVATTGAVTIDRGRTVVELLKLASLGCVFVAGAALGQSRKSARLSQRIVLVLGAAFAIAALARLGTGGSATGRLDAGLPSANVAGTLFACLMVMSLSLIGGSRGPTSRNRFESWIISSGPGLALFALFATALALTASRGAIMSACAGVFVYLLARGLSKDATAKRTIGTIAAIAVVAAALGLIQGGLAFHRFSLSPSLSSLNGRIPIFQPHYEAFLRSPLMGYGLGSFDSVNKMIMTVSAYPYAWDVRALHNTYVQWLEEAGALGAFPMFATIGSVIGLAGVSVLRMDRSAAMLAGFLAADAVILVHGAADFALGVFGIAAWWALVLGLQLGIASSRQASTQR